MKECMRVLEDLYEKGVTGYVPQRHAGTLNCLLVLSPDRLCHLSTHDSRPMKESTASAGCDGSGRAEVCKVKKSKVTEGDRQRAGR